MKQRKATHVLEVMDLGTRVLGVGFGAALGNVVGSMATGGTIPNATGGTTIRAGTTGGVIGALLGAVAGYAIADKALR